MDTQIPAIPAWVSDPPSPEEQNAFGNLTFGQVCSMWRDASLLFHDFKWRAARQTYTNLAATMPDCLLRSILYMNMGIISLHLGHVCVAEGHFKKAAEIEPNYCIPLQLLGTAQFDQGKLEQARDAFNKCRSNLSPGRQTIDYQNLGLQYVLRLSEVFDNERACETLRATFVDERDRGIRRVLHRVSPGFIFESPGDESADRHIVKPEQMSAVHVAGSGRSSRPASTSVTIPKRQATFQQVLGSTSESTSTAPEAQFKGHVGHSYQGTLCPTNEATTSGGLQLAVEPASAKTPSRFSKLIRSSSLRLVASRALSRDHTEKPPPSTTSFSPKSFGGIQKMMKRVSRIMSRPGDPTTRDSLVVGNPTARDPLLARSPTTGDLDVTGSPASGDTLVTGSDPESSAPAARQPKSAMIPREAHGVPQERVKDLASFAKDTGPGKAVTKVTQPQQPAFDTETQTSHRPHELLAQHGPNHPDPLGWYLKNFHSTHSRGSSSSTSIFDGLTESKRQSLARHEALQKLQNTDRPAVNPGWAAAREEFALDMPEAVLERGRMVPDADRSAPSTGV